MACAWQHSQAIRTDGDWSETKPAQLACAPRKMRPCKRSGPKLPYEAVIGGRSCSRPTEWK
jgi:hypothetical protein